LHKSIFNYNKPLKYLAADDAIEGGGLKATSVLGYRSCINLNFNIYAFRLYKQASLGVLRVVIFFHVITSIAALYQI